MSAWSCIRILLLVIPPSTCNCLNGIPQSLFIASNILKENHVKHFTQLSSTGRKTLWIVSNSCASRRQLVQWISLFYSTCPCNLYPKPFSRGSGSPSSGGCITEACSGLKELLEIRLCPRSLCPISGNSSLQLQPSTTQPPLFKGFVWLFEEGFGGYCRQNKYKKQPGCTNFFLLGQYCSGIPIIMKVLV